MISLKFINAMKKIIYSIVAALALLTSCRSGKEYNRPSIEIAASFRGANGNTLQADTISIASIRWKDFFTDTALQQIIDSVLHRNYNMAVALNNIRLNDQYLKQANVAWLPVVKAGISASSNRFSDNSLNGTNGFNLNNTIGTNHLDDYSVNLGASWDADIWGKIKNQKEVALATYMQSTETVKALQTRLISVTASSYYNLLMLHEQLAIADKNLILNDSIVHIIRLQMENGEVTALAVQQAEVQKKKTASLIPILEQALYIQENALGILMARQPGSLAITQNLYSFTIPDTFKTGIPASLLSYRPDVRESEFALRAANARIGVSQANMYPALSINVVGGLNSFQSGNWLTLPASLFGNVAGNLLQPVFNKRRLKTQLNISKIEYEQVVINFKSKVMNAATEVSDALIQAEKLKEKIEIANSQNIILKSALPNAQLLFTNGMANYLEVISVQQNLLQNELDIANLKRQQITAYIQLYRSLGGGVK